LVAVTARLREDLGWLPDELGEGSFFLGLGKGNDQGSCSLYRTVIEQLKV
jgi:hypothetical protein